MFIKSCVRKKDWKEFRTHYLTESYRDKETWKVKHNHLINLSKLPEKQILALKTSFNSDTKIDKITLENLQIIDIKEYWNIAIFSKLFDNDFSKIIDKKYYKEIKAITINKIFNTKSKNWLDNWLKKVDLSYRTDTKTKQNKLYEAIDYLDDNKDKIEKELIKKNKIREADLLLYDITSTYFEWKWDESICKYGYSRDHRWDRLQVNIWLVTDKNWLPVRVEIIEWNITDKQTIEWKIKDLKEELGIENITFVFDRWMKSITNLKTIKEAGYDYITALSHAQLKKKAQENENIQLSIFDKKDLTEFIIDEKDNNTWDIIQKKYVLCHNPTKREKDEYDRNKLIEKTEKKLKDIQELKTYKNWKIEDLDLQDKISKVINKYKCEKYLNYEIKDKKFDFTKNEEIIKRDNLYDWFYMIESTNTNIDKDDVEQKYKSLQYVERAFDEIKNLIEIRPVFHYKAKRIKWHILSCFISYYILHKFKTKIGSMIKEYTLDTLLTELECIKKTYFKIDTIYFEKLNNLTDLQKRLFNIFNIKYYL